MKKMIGLIAASAMCMSAAAVAQEHAMVMNTYEVTITNVTTGQSFTPILVATHSPHISMFTVGEEPSQALADLAEGGDTGPLMQALEDSGQAMDMAVAGDGLIGPGESVTVQVKSAGQSFLRLSLAGMLLPTNDSFVAINSLRLPRWSTMEYAQAYDAGSEMNDELCASIPGPTCGGEPFSEGLGEGFVHIARGITGEGDLAASAYDWRNPVAIVRVSRIE